VAWPPEGGSKCRANLIPPEEAGVGTSLHQGLCHVPCRAVTSGPDAGASFGQEVRNIMDNLSAYIRPPGMDHGKWDWWDWWDNSPKALVLSELPI
jgi:hypothetical protein